MSLYILRSASEVSLKSKSVRAEFHRNLRKNLMAALDQNHLSYKIKQKHHYLFLTIDDQSAVDPEPLISKIFGIGSFSKVLKVFEYTDFISFLTTAEEIFSQYVKDKTFAVRCKKSGHYNFKTLDLERELGSRLNRVAKSVDLTNPQITAQIDFIDDQCYLYLGRKRGAGGLPLGSQGKALCLLSGGFDSAVAAWQILKRGVQLDYLFLNLGSQENERPVIEVAQLLAQNWSFGGSPQLYILDFKPIVEEIKFKTKPSYQQVILKKMMYLTAENWAHHIRASAIITGEALGQVSSQTIENLCAINLGLSLPLLRPLIGTDKIDIIQLAKKIGTEKISAQVEELCSISSGRPVTKANSEFLEKQIEKLSNDIIDNELKKIRTLNLNSPTLLPLKNGYLVSEVPENVKVIDCQLGRGFEIWHYPGAQHIPPDQLLQNPEQLPRESSYFLYCTHGQQSSLIAEKLIDLGYQVTAYDGSVKDLRKK